MNSPSGGTVPRRFVLSTRTSNPALVATLATRCGLLLLQLRQSATNGTPDLATLARSRGTDFLARTLRAVRPTEPILMIPDVDRADRLRARRVWIVRPLDGEEDYLAGAGGWSVHVALWAGGRLCAAAVALPAEGATLSTAIPYQLAPVPPHAPRIVAAPGLSQTLALWIAPAIGASVTNVPSTGAGIAAMLRGSADAYLRAEPHHDGVSAAPVGLAAAAGLHASRLDGSPLRYNTPSPVQPTLLVCRRDLAPSITALAGRAMLPARGGR